VVAGLSSAIDIDEIAAGLPRRIHEVMADYVDKTPGQIALVEDGIAWSYGDLDRRVTEIANVLSSLGVRAVDRMLNSIKPRLTSYTGRRKSSSSPSCRVAQPTRHASMSSRNAGAATELRRGSR
jgi:hypothetical protein